MRDVDSVRREFEKRLDATIDRHRRQVRETARQLFDTEMRDVGPLPRFSDWPDVESQIAAYDDWVERRIAAQRRVFQVEHPAAPTTSPLLSVAASRLGPSITATSFSLPDLRAGRHRICQQLRVCQAL